MAKKGEVELRPLKEMNFSGGEIDYLLEKDIKLLSLRVPDSKYDFEVGEVIEAKYLDIPGGSSFLVVVDNVKLPLKEFSKPELLLDGYESVEAAAADLRTFGEKYKGITEESVVQAVMTISEEKFFSLSREEQEELLRKGGKAVMKENGKLAKEVFYPAWCRWIVSKRGGLEGWWEFLLSEGLMDQETKARQERDYGLELATIDNFTLELIWESGFEDEPEEDLRGWFEGVIKLKQWDGDGEI